MNEVRELMKNTADRQRYIEFCLLYKGEVSRADIMSKFGIKEASATRDLNQYSIDSKNKNSYFDSRTKKHLIKDSTFSPLFFISDSEALYWLKVESSPISQELLAYRFKRLSLPNQHTIAPIIRAIMNNKCVMITYYSLNSGVKKERVIVPHSIIDDGLRIYIRAYDRNKGLFVDFSSSRIVSSELLDCTPKDNENIIFDEDWNKIIELIIAPHPKVKNKEVIAFEYEMVRDELKVKIRSSVAGYFLRTWNIDCSYDYELSSDVYHLCLKNIHQLNDVTSIKKLAPR